MQRLSSRQGNKAAYPMLDFKFKRHNLNIKKVYAKRIIITPVNPTPKAKSTHPLRDWCSLESDHETMPKRPKDHSIKP